MATTTQHNAGVTSTVADVHASAVVRNREVESAADGEPDGGAIQ